MEKVIFDLDSCKACGLCVAACPVNIIEFSSRTNLQGFRPAMVKRQEECISCGNCARFCPDAVITVYRENQTRKAS